jgi:hypothetical protein
LAIPRTKIHVKNILSKNVCLGFSFRTILALALQANVIWNAFSISPLVLETQNMLATSRRSLVALALVAAPLIDEACYIIRCILAQRDIYFQLVD